MDKRDTDSPRSATINAMEPSSGRPTDQTAQTEVVRETVQASDHNTMDSAPVAKTGRRKGSKNSKAIQRSRTHAKVLEYRALGIPVRDIAKATDLSVTRVKDLLKQFEPTFAKLKEIDAYRDVRQELLTATELQLLESVNDPEKLAAASLRDSAYAFDVMYKTGRLERGLSTDNKAVQTVHVRADRPKFATDN